MSIYYKLIDALEDLFLSLVPQKSILAADADKWITIGSGKNDLGERTGRHVKIDEHGNIVGGSLPKSAKGKSITSWWKSSSKSSSSSKAESVINNSAGAKSNRT